MEEQAWGIINSEQIICPHCKNNHKGDDFKIPDIDEAHVDSKLTKCEVCKRHFRILGKYEKDHWKYYLVRLKST